MSAQALSKCYRPRVPLVERITSDRGRDYESAEDRSPYRRADDRQYDSPRRYRSRSRSRSPEFDRRLTPDRPRQSVAPWESRRTAKEGIFAGLRYHFLSTSSAEVREAKRICALLNREGAKGIRDLSDVDIVFVRPDISQLNLLVRPEPISRSLAECHRDGFTLNDIYHYIANRELREHDNRRHERKCVVQAGWINACLQAGRRLEAGSKAGYEIKVNNTPAPFLFTRQPSSSTQALAGATPHTPPMATDPRRIPTTTRASVATTPPPVPEPPSQYPITARSPSPDQAGDINQGSEPMDLDLEDEVEPTVQDTSTASISPQTPGNDVNRARAPEVACDDAEGEEAELEDRKPDIGPWSKLKSDQWKPPPDTSTSVRSMNRPQTPALSPATFPQSVPLESQVSIALQRSLQPTDPVGYNDKARSLARAPDASQVEVRPAAQQPKANVASMPPMMTKVVPSASSAPTTQPHHATVRSAKSVASTISRRLVFARSVLPWTLHVYTSDKMTELLIERFGGGLLVSLDRAAIVIIPVPGLRVAQTPEQVELVQAVIELGGGRAVLSKDWVAECIDQDELVDIEPYRIALPSRAGQLTDETMVSQDMDSCHLEEPELLPEDLQDDTQMVADLQTDDKRQIESASEVAAQVTEHDEMMLDPMAVSYNNDDDDDVVYIGTGFKSAGPAAITDLAKDKRSGMPTPSLSPHVKPQWTPWLRKDPSMSPVVNIGQDQSETAVGLSVPIIDRTSAFVNRCVDADPTSSHPIAGAESYAEDEVDELEEDDSDDDDIPLKDGRLAAEKHMVIEHVSDPKEKARIVASVIRDDVKQRSRFDTVLNELEIWKEEKFPGHLKAFFERMEIKHGLTAKQWKNAYYRWAVIYWQFVEGLQFKGTRKLRGVR